MAPLILFPTVPMEPSGGEGDNRDITSWER